MFQKVKSNVNVRVFKDRVSCQCPVCSFHWEKRYDEPEVIVLLDIGTKHDGCPAIQLLHGKRGGKDIFANQARPNGLD